MTYVEYKNLPFGTRVDSIECIVIPKGFKSSFDTGTTITSSANNTQGVFGQVSVGLIAMYFLEIMVLPGMLLRL